MKIGIILLCLCLLYLVAGAQNNGENPRPDGSSGKMMFCTMPKDEPTMRDSSGWVMKNLNDLAPGTDLFVVVEPNGIDFARYARGDYDTYMRRFLASLKQSRVDDRRIIRWMPFDEGNNYFWDPNHFDAKSLCGAFNRSEALIKEYFPNDEVWLLLDAYTNRGDNQNYTRASLDPYLENIDKNNLSGFALQWFGHLHDYPSDATVFNATINVDHNVVVKAAKKLSASKILFAIGTPGVVYGADGKSVIVTLNPNVRLKTVMSALTEAVRARQELQMVCKNKTVETWVNSFEDNKKDTDEKTDWSYNQDEQNRQVHREFMETAQKEGILVSIKG